MRNITENVVLCLVAAAIEATSKRVLETVKLDWRKKLTDNIHKLYFANMVLSSPSAPHVYSAIHSKSYFLERRFRHYSES